MSVITFTDGSTISSGGSIVVDAYTTRNLAVTAQIVGDSNATDINFGLGQGTIENEHDLADTNRVQTNGIDATGGYVYQFPEVSGYERVGFIITNNASTATTVEVYGIQW